MRPASRKRSLTVDEVVREAARACDPEQRAEGVTALVESFEDDERPATAPDDLAGELRSAAREIDPDALEPEVAVAAATAYWLATNPGDGDDAKRAIREGARLFFGDEAPASVSGLLEARGLA